MRPLFSNLANIFILGLKQQRLTAAEILPQCALPLQLCIPEPGPSQSNAL